MSEDATCDFHDSHFGASYPDATCIDGFLWDLDSCDIPGGPLSRGGDIPCPMCNTEAYLEGVKADVEGMMDDGVSNVRVWNSAVARCRRWNPTATDAAMRKIFRVDAWMGTDAHGNEIIHRIDVSAGLPEGPEAGPAPPLLDLARALASWDGEARERNGVRILAGEPREAVGAFLALQALGDIHAPRAEEALGLIRAARDAEKARYGPPSGWRLDPSAIAEPGPEDTR